jgi:hypothetical protein
MRTNEDPLSHTPYQASHAAPSRERRTPARPLRRPGASDADALAVQARLACLIQEHRDLDGAIAALFETKSGDPLLIARLKKRKLQIKDEIARIEPMD